MKPLFISLFILYLFSDKPKWGFFAHRLINENAVYTLPQPLNSFFKSHIYHITSSAINADKRVYIDTAEGKKHFIDLDRWQPKDDSLYMNEDSLDYNENSLNQTLDTLMVPWYKLKVRQDRFNFLQHGMIPWQIEISYQNLVYAFQKKNTKSIIKHAADLGHYIADAHVPLHTSSNYNGQFSNQLGIHALWESRLPERFFEHYNLMVGSASYIEHVPTFAWQTIKESHARLDSVLLLEKATADSLHTLHHKSFQARGNSIFHTYSNTYLEIYHDLLEGMVERRMQKSIHAVGSLWWSAWIDAGQPDLPVKTKKDKTESFN